MAKPWADKPYDLLLIPGQPGVKTCTDPDVLSVAAEMANVHNAFIRGLNSVILQAPHITSPTDISDLLLYLKAWTDSVHHHHAGEEAIIFPELNALAQEAGLGGAIMDANIAQHDLFEGKLKELLMWINEVRGGRKEYDLAVLEGYIEEFAPCLIAHLHDEIDTILKLDGCDGVRAEKAMAKGASEGVKTADTSLVVPLVLGCVDKTYPGSAEFPPVPFFLYWLSAYWFERKHKGTWRFSPCDHWGKPRPLQFL